MSPLLIFACIAGVSIWPTLSWGQQPCRVTVESKVEVAGGEFSLADLLAPGACPSPSLRRAAARVRAGSAPLTGSVRVIEGRDMRTRLNRVAASVEPGTHELAEMRIPERVTVRRAGMRASCADIGARILASPAASALVTAAAFSDAAKSDAAASFRDLQCGAAGRIPQDAALELTRAVWDPTLGAWDVSARCVRPGDCVPFLVRLSGHGPQSRTMLDGRTPPRAAIAPSQNPLVRPGETVTLLWDQDGIRLVVPAVCLDRGVAGEPVRARIVRGGRTIRAIVESAGKLRAASSGKLRKGLVP